jgi:LPS sulfotransferase NodH
MTKLPNFLIVGAAKSGTTSLYEYLRAHPQIFMPERKEPSYFEPKAGGVKSWDEYCRLFERAGDFKRVGEASVSYLMSPEAPARIERALGKNIDIVVLLRNPVDMAYSLWGHEIREGFEQLEFIDSVRDEARRLSDPDYEKSIRRWRYDMTYMHRARYAPQLQRYFDRFGRERVHVFLFEEFFRAGLPHYSKLLELLGVDHGHRPVEAAHNRAGTVRSKYVRRILRERMAWKESLKRFVPGALRARMMGALARFNRIDRPLPPISGEAIRFMWSELASDVETLSKQLDRDLWSIWKFEASLRAENQIQNESGISITR